MRLFKYPQDQSNRPPMSISSSSSAGCSAGFWATSSTLVSFTTSCLAGSELAALTSGMLNLCYGDVVPWLKWKSSNVFETISDDDWDGCLNWVPGWEGESSQVSNTPLELSNERCWVNVDDFFRQDGAIVIGWEDLHSVLEGLQVQLLQKGCFWSFDFLSFGTHFEFLSNLNLALVNFGGDVQGVEEVDLRRVETSWSWGNGEVNGR